MRKYFFRQFSIRWFERYLIGCGIVLNALAVISVMAAVIPNSAERNSRHDHRARIELEDGSRCDQLMANTEFAPGKEFEIRLGDETPVKLSYKDKGANTRTKEGHDIHMVEVERVGLLFFEVDNQKMIRRCIPAAMLDCVAASGSFRKSGECVVAVNLPSDCEVMKGVLTNGFCQVPPSSRILKPMQRSVGKICSTPGCADGKAKN